MNRVRNTITAHNAGDFRPGDRIHALLSLDQQTLWVIARVEGCTITVRRPRLYERAWWWLCDVARDAAAWVRAWTETRRLIRFLRRTK